MSHLINIVDNNRTPNAKTVSRDPSTGRKRGAAKRRRNNRSKAKKLGFYERSVINMRKFFTIFGFSKLIPFTVVYIKLIRRFIKNHGIRFTTLLFKDLYNECLLYSLGLKFTPTERIWLRRHKKDNYPSCLRDLKPFLRGSKLERRMALTLLRIYEAVELKPIPDLGSVIDPSIGTSYAQSINDTYVRFLGITGFATKVRRRFKSFQARSLYDSVIKKRNPFCYSSKRGVDGFTLLTAGKQAQAVKKSGLYGYVIKFVQNFHIGNFKEVFDYNHRVFLLRDDFQKTSGKAETVLGRISFISCPGAKTRLIAIGNYYIQTAFKFLHDILFKILRRIPQDGTHDQTSQATRIKIVTLERKRIWSFDLTKATDRFPIGPQIALLKFINLDIGSLWEKILSSMTFIYDGQEYKYAVGQPMGLYSSWAVFALTHHAIIRYCAFLEKLSNFEDYAVLGDDVAIWNEKVALRYKSLLLDLGLEISMAKSFTPEQYEPSGSTIAEFAKRLFVDGSEYTPIPPELINVAMENHFDIPEFMLFLQSRDCVFERVPVARFVSALNLSVKKRFELLCQLRIKEQLGADFSVNLESTPEENEILQRITKLMIINVRVSSLSKQASDLWSKLFDLEDQIGCSLAKRAVDSDHTNLVVSQVMSGLVHDMLELEQRLIKLIPDVGKFKSKKDEDEVLKLLPKLEEIEYLPIVDPDKLLDLYKGPKSYKIYRGKFVQKIARSAAVKAYRKDKLSKPIQTILFKSQDDFEEELDWVMVDDFESDLGIPTDPNCGNHPTEWIYPKGWQPDD